MPPIFLVDPSVSQELAQKKHSKPASGFLAENELILASEVQKHQVSCPNQSQILSRLNQVTFMLSKTSLVQNSDPLEFYEGPLKKRKFN